MKTEKSEYRAGFDSGNTYHAMPTIPGFSEEFWRCLRLDSIRKARRAVRDPFTPPLVRAYWSGMLAGIKANLKTRETLSL